MSHTPRKNTKIEITSACPCGSEHEYAQCCLPYLNGERQPETAVSLMRSRYTAYTQHAESYLLRTWHTSTRPIQLNLSEQPSVQWLGLKILHTQTGAIDDNTGTVEFIARCKQKGTAVRLHETSHFVKEGGCWYYLHGS